MGNWGLGTLRLEIVFSRVKKVHGDISGPEFMVSRDIYIRAVLSFYPQS